MPLQHERKELAKLNKKKAVLCSRENLQLLHISDPIALIMQCLCVDN